MDNTLKTNINDILRKDMSQLNMNSVNIQEDEIDDLQNMLKEQQLKQQYNQQLIQQQMMQQQMNQQSNSPVMHQQHHNHNHNPQLMQQLMQQNFDLTEKQNKFSSILTELKLPIILLVLFIVFNSEFVINLINCYIPFLAPVDGKQSLMGLAFRGLLFAGIFYLLLKFVLDNK